MSPSNRENRIGFVDISDSVEDEARDRAGARLHENQESLRGIKGFVTKIWKHNLFREYYRQKQIAIARQEVLAETDQSAQVATGLISEDPELRAVVDRFLTEDEETVHYLRGEQREILGDDETAQALKEEIQTLIIDFATGVIDEGIFFEERNRILSLLPGATQEVEGRGVRYTDNLYSVALEIKNSIDNGIAQDSLDLDFDVVVGRAKSAVRTEAQYSAVDRITEKIVSSKVGRFVNETVVASAVSLVYSIGTITSQRFARSRLAQWGSFGATAILAGGIAGLRESKTLEDERRQHFREMARGENIDSRNSARRTEMEQFRYNTEEAQDVINRLQTYLYTDVEGEQTERVLTEPEQKEALLVLAELEARIAISDKKRIDLIAYSNSDRIEREQTELDIARAQLKVRLRQLAGAEFDEQLTDWQTLNEEMLLMEGGEISEKNRLFGKMKRGRVGMAIAKGALTGLAIGGLTQEVTSLVRGDQQGFVEGMLQKWRGVESADQTQHLTALEGLRQWVSGETHYLARDDEVVNIAGQSFKLPTGVELVAADDGTYNLVKIIDTDHQKVLAEGIGISTTRGLNVDSVAQLEKLGIIVNTTTQNIVHETQQQVAVGASEYVQHHSDATTAIRRDLWYTNDTPAPVFDKNELRLWWGGNDNTGIDSHGNFVFNASQMQPGGSYHGGESTNAQQLIAAGKMRMLFSLSRETQGQVFEVPINAHGDAIIDPKSEIGRLFFTTDESGQAIFKGKFAEVAQTMGTKNGLEHFRILATEVGEGVKSVSDTVTTKEVETIATTFFDVPADRLIDAPPVIPLFGRLPLEPVAQGEVGLTYLGPDPRHIINEPGHDPRRKLERETVLPAYIDRWNKRWRQSVETLADQIDTPMNNQCRLAICIPAAGHQEGKNIYRTLTGYLGQRTVGKEPLDTSLYEIVVFVNRPDDTTPDTTLAEIQRFQHDHPELPVRVMDKALPRAGLNIGKVRKLLTDAVLLRDTRRGKTAPELIIVSNDADNEGLSKTYLSNFINKFQQAEETGEIVEGVLGKVEWDPKMYVQSPLLYASTRLFQYMDIAWRHHPIQQKRSIGSSGANFAFRSTIYAAVGGYEDDPDYPAGEDLLLGRKINSYRYGIGKLPVIFGGAGSVIYTSARRSVDALKKGLSPAEQWRDFGADDTLRTHAPTIEPGLTLEDIRLDASKKEAFQIELTRLFNRTLHVYNRTEPASLLARRALGFMGIDYKVIGDEIIITNTDRLLDQFEEYQNKGLANYRERIGDTT